MKIAITGSIGSGKSAVLKYLRELGFICFSCDEENARLLRDNPKIIAKIIKQFPEVNKNGIIDKQQLANLVFQDGNNLKKLTKIMHPAIKTEMFSFLDKNKVSFVEVPLLFESQWDQYFDCIISVVIDEELRNERLAKRDIAIELTKKRLQFQVDQDYKVQHSDFVIYNNKDLIRLKQEVDLILKRLNIC